ncbi:MAG: EamA family transporter [Alphaproteobacteria bacterium]|nr:EamA family transporter [Alphaproteobacteria bacterium]
MSPLTATLIGSTAVLLWATLALFTAWSGAVPPFLLVAICFATATAMIAAKWTADRLRGRGGPVLSRFRVPLGAALFGTAGLFGYHFFYFTALKNAPPVEAGLIAYLWPLLIVLFSALLPGERLRWFHLVGALMGLAGAGLLVTKGGSLDFDARHTLGYLAAMVCALTWSSYSVLSRRFQSVSTDAVGTYCAASAVLGLICHLMLEETVLPSAGIEWLAVFALGLGPVGAAFFTWDIGMKRGHIQVLGAFAYAAPLLSTLLLVAVGIGEATRDLAIACALIVGGALVASKELLTRRRA